MTSNESYTDFDKELATALEVAGESPISEGEFVGESESERPATGPGTGSGSHFRGNSTSRGSGPGSRKHIPYNGDTSAFFNAANEIPTGFGKRYVTEKVEHRLVAYLKAQGFSQREIAERTGYSYGSVCAICKLPWVRQVIMEEISTLGKDAVKQVLESSALDSVFFLLETRDDIKAQTRDRITAAKELLDRTLGKSNQPITYAEAKDPAKLSDKELAQIVNSGNRVN